MTHTNLLSVLVVGLVCACSADVSNGPFDSAEQASHRGGGSGSGSAGSSSGSGSSSSLCSNGDGVNSSMAALAVAAARELGRWQPLQDFVWTGSGLQLTSTGKSRCADHVCWNTQAILDLQHAPNGSVKIAGVPFVAANFLSQLGSNFSEQQICESRPDNHTSDNCPAEQHQLAQASVSRGECDTVFTFNATSTSGGALSEPAQLKNKLIWVGYPENGYLQFSSNGSSVSIDPTAGLNEGSTTTSGSCTAACVKFSLSSAAGQCCSCLGVTGSYATASFSPYIYLCQ